MTQEQALAEARGRWGEKAEAYCLRFSTGDAPIYIVAPKQFATGGRGASYEAAFAAADGHHA